MLVPPDETGIILGARVSERRSAEAAKYEMSNELVFAWMDGNGFALDLRSYYAHAVVVRLAEMFA